MSPENLQRAAVELAEAIAILAVGLKYVSGHARPECRAMALASANAAMESVATALALIDPTAAPPSTDASRVVLHARALAKGRTAAGGGQ